MKRLASLLLALALCAGLAVPALAAEAGFSDVPETHTFYAAVMDCAAKGITSGYADGTFKPGNSVTRAQFCVMLSRAFYPGEVEKYNTKVYTDQGWFVPNTRALYLAGVLTDTSFVSSFATADVMGQTINRYDMAQLITNIMTAKGFSAAEAQKSEARGNIADYKSIPAQYQEAVKNVFALGIITGYSDGTFGGENVMNRGQGCVVIYRMAQYTPAADGPVTPDADVPPATEPETPEQPETPTVKTLRNGQPITEENVLELLVELQANYPEGTDFANGYTYAMRQSVGGGGSVDVNRVTNTYTRSEGGKTSTTSGCGGWAAFVSDYIFGTSGFPARKVSIENVRPGDIEIQLDGNNKLKHVAIVTSKPVYDAECDVWRWNTTDGTTATGKNTDPYYVTWKLGDGCWPDMMDQMAHFYTRYPD